jgi:hypothetical protein
MAKSGAGIKKGEEDPTGLPSYARSIGKVKDTEYLKAAQRQKQIALKGAKSSAAVGATSVVNSLATGRGGQEEAAVRGAGKTPAARSQSPKSHSSFNHTSGNRRKRLAAKAEATRREDEARAKEQQDTLERGQRRTILAEMQKGKV